MPKEIEVHGKIYELIEFTESFDCELCDLEKNCIYSLNKWCEMSKGVWRIKNDKTK